MVVADLSLAQEVGRYWGSLLRDEATAQRLWVRPVRDFVELWLLTSPIDVDSERRLYDEVGRVYDRFPDAYLRTYVLNPNNYHNGDALSAVPGDATEMPLPPA